MSQFSFSAQVCRSAFLVSTVLWVSSCGSSSPNTIASNPEITSVDPGVGTVAADIGPDQTVSLISNPSFMVNSHVDGVDANPGDGSCATSGGVCSLRAAIQEANASAGAQTIAVPAGTYTLSLIGAGEDAAATGDLDITSEMTIAGAGAATIINTASGWDDRIFEVKSGADLTLSQVKLEGGNLASGGGGGIDVDQGGTLDLSGSLLMNNVVQNGNGGGILSSGDTTIFDTQILGNQTTVGGGGGIFLGGTGILEITQSVVRDNSAANGGGFWNSGQATVINTRIKENDAFSTGAGIFQKSDFDLVIRDSEISNNITANDPNDSFCCGDGAGIAVVDGLVTVENSQVTDNQGRLGAGIYVASNEQISLTDSVVSNNTARLAGGAVWIKPSATVTLERRQIDGNSSGSNWAGAIGNAGNLKILDSTVSNNSAVAGGALHQSADQGIPTTEIRGSTIVGNSATWAGALWNSVGELRIINSTLSDNEATNQGGAIFVSNAEVVLENSTVADNRTIDTKSFNGGGGIYVDSGNPSSLKASNTIIANNTSGGSGPDILGGLISQGYNLIGNTSGVTISGDTTGNLLGVDPLLDPLADNGGPTQTYRPQSGSPVIDAGDPGFDPNTFSPPLDTDQRGAGFDREAAINVDIGSYEVQQAPSSPPVLEQTFLNPSLTGGDNFGNSVSISDNRVLVGAIFDETGGPNNGAAYLFDGTSGALKQTFLNPTSGQDQFGYPVSVSEDRVLIGARLDDAGATDSGIAYLFDAVTGNPQQTYLNPTPDINDQFGRSLSVSGDRVLIAAPFDDAGAIDSGAAYLFDATTGSLLQTFVNPTPDINDLFGSSVALSGERVLIGAQLDDAGAIDSGAAYLFDATTGSLLQTFVNPTPASVDAFGVSASISGDRVLVGAFLDDAGAIDSGAAHLFDATTGSLLQTFVNPTPDINDQFGKSVSLSGERVLIGAFRDDLGGSDSGVAYLFDATTGSLLQTLPNPTPASGDVFGVSVSVFGDRALIGARLDDTVRSHSGAAYLYQIP